MFFLFKQKTAYGMRISDWSSDVCSSDLRLNQSEAWLSRYLDLARFHPDLIGAFPDPFELKISHVVTLKPLLKGDGSRASVMEEARRLKADREIGRAHV